MSTPAQERTARLARMGAAPPPGSNIVNDRVADLLRVVEKQRAEIASLNDRLAKVESADNWLKHNSNMRAKLIINRVSDAYDISVANLVGADRKQGFVLPRHIAMYLIHSLTSLSLSSISARFGGRDHTSILFAIRKIATLSGDEACAGGRKRVSHLRYDPALAATVASLRAELTGERA